MSLKKALKTDQFFNFRAPSQKGRLRRSVGRTLLLDGKRLGRTRFVLPPGPDIWICPYFDSVTRTLRFRRRDGMDETFHLDLSDLAQSKDYRPILAMAHAEGLLDKIPGA